VGGRVRPQARGPCGGHQAEKSAEKNAEASADEDEARTDLVRVRRRGAGTELAPNA